jgi:hypothetical protein
MGSEVDVCLLANADAGAGVPLTVLLLPGLACGWVGGGTLYGPSVVDDKPACPPGPAPNCNPPPACAKVEPGK